MAKIRKKNALSSEDSIVLLGNLHSDFGKYGLSKTELDYLKTQFKNDKKQVSINQLHRWVFVQIIEEKKQTYITTEFCRRAGNSLLSQINENKINKITIVDLDNRPNEVIALIEGMALGNYQFLKYKKNIEKETHSLETINAYSKNISSKDIDQLEILVDAVNTCRTLVNEPVLFLNAVQLSKEFQKLGKQAGFKVEVLNKSKIEALKMGGLLAVNYGSIIPPTFSIMEWKPSNAKNNKPFLLVGKGVVYDTGGLSLKPTLNSMDQMKCDMAGAAAVACTMFAIAKAKLPVHVIALAPATDNRPGENAYTPGDVITMHNGLTVEVLSTDAEGRVSLGDALSYAQKFKPELVIDLATLTGAAAAAIGKYGIVSMGTAQAKYTNALKESGNTVYERLAELPFWDEYGELIKSSIAEIKNVGGPVAGAITAGKFLEHFTNYPWIHLDIAGPAFTTANDSYKPMGGTGVGVRLLFDFFKNIK